MSELIIPRPSTRVHMDFFQRHADEVARDLLGRVLVKERAGKSNLYVRLDEVAAYEGVVKSMTKGALEIPGTIGVSTKYGKNLIDLSTLSICEASCVTLIGGTLFDGKKSVEKIKGPGKLSEVLEITKNYDGVPLNFARIWIGGETVGNDKILKRNRSGLPENCKGYFYFR
ncbi:MAG: DNA-3-methyladenine glycosylase [Nanoarchaeota archaeon]